MATDEPPRNPDGDPSSPNGSGGLAYDPSGAGATSTSGFFLDAMRRRPMGRRALSSLTGLLFIGGLALFAYPFFTDVYTEQVIQSRLEDQFQTIQVDTHEEWQAQVAQGSGGALTRIALPSIDVETLVVEGTSAAALRAGAGHYPNTPLPGQVGNVAIAGHRTTYGAPFENLDQLADGDTITVETLAGTFDYRVTSVARPADEPPWEPVFVVNPSQTEVLEDTPTQATLTLTTCNPKYSARERLIVKAEFDVRANQPQPQAPPTRADTTVGIDAGLSGDDASRLPTLLWGLVAAAVGALWWLVFHRYRRWTTWIAGAIPFVVALAIFYYFLERLLPANY